MARVYEKKMAGSFRRRLFAIAALTVIVCGAASIAILFLSRMTLDERVAHAHENVVREVERMRGAMTAIPFSERRSQTQESGALTSGYLENANTNESGPFVAEAIANGSDSAVLTRIDDGVPVLVASAKIAGGGYVFAVQHVVAGKETRGLRVVVVLLVVLTFGLIVASLRTMRAVERDVSGLRASLAALGKDLSATVARPKLRELGEVASGVEALANDLKTAEIERERLTRALSERERLAALGRVAAGIAHEVRNPLASMKLRADLARTSEEATPAIAKDLEDIADEIARLDRLVTDLLVVAGRRAGLHTEVDLGEVGRKRASLLSPWAQEKGVTISCTGEARALVDVDAITRALDNLLRNAIEASPRDLRVLLHVTSHGDSARVTVTDQGEGVSKERAHELFEPFFTTKSEGTGLGLALARAVANAHHGTLTYERDHETTRFTLEIATNDRV